MKPLNDKQETFCQEYVNNGFNAFRAYMFAYPYCKENSADANSIRLIGKDRIKARIDEIKAEISQKFELTREYVVNGLKDLAENQKELNPAVSRAAFSDLGRIAGVFEADNSQKQSLQAIQVVVKPAESTK